MSKEKSEFGKGLVICLVKFAEHYERLMSYKETYKNIGEYRAVEMWFNGASDHLYEIEVPTNWKGTKMERKVKELQKYALKIGHGFTGEKFKEADVFKALEMTHKIALLIDKHLGLSPDIGEW